VLTPSRDVPQDNSSGKSGSRGALAQNTRSRSSHALRGRPPSRTGLPSGSGGARTPIMSASSMQAAGSTKVAQSTKATPSGIKGSNTVPVARPAGAVSAATMVKAARKAASSVNPLVEPSDVMDRIGHRGRSASEDFALAQQQQEQQLSAGISAEIDPLIDGLPSALSTVASVDDDDDNDSNAADADEDGQAATAGKSKQAGSAISSSVTASAASGSAAAAVNTTAVSVSSCAICAVQVRILLI